MSKIFDLEGTIFSVSDGIIRLHGLSKVMQGEMIALPDNRFAIALIVQYKNFDLID